jgi:hypothetical protein
MDNVFFTPYIGTNYSQGYNGKKILALGESHYINDDDEGRDHFRDYPQLKNFTNDIIRNYLDYLDGQLSHQGWMNTYTRFARAFYNGDLPRTGVTDFWTRIAFYNYIQEPLADTRMAPSSELFAKYEAPFWEVVHDSQPDLIVVWGLRLWDSLPFPKTPLMGDLFQIHATPDGQPTLILPITHPSAPSFSYQTTYNLLSAALTK